jgi:hypothetical protein
MTLQKIFAEHSARITQTPLTNKTQAFPAGNSRSLGMLADNHSTHHHSHLPDAQKEEAVEVVAEEEEEMVEADYLLQWDQACSLHTDEPLTLNS